MIKDSLSGEWGILLLQLGHWIVAEIGDLECDSLLILLYLYFEQIAILDSNWLVYTCRLQGIFLCIQRCKNLVL